MSQAVKDNLSFIGVCLIIIAALIIISVLYERFLMKERKKLSNTHYVTYVAIFSALAGVLMLFEIPLFFAPVFYKIDLSEIPVLICTFYLGPVAGVLTEMIKVLIKLLLKGTTTAFVGDFANFAVGCSFILPASMIYHANKTRKTALIGMLVGTLVMTTFGSLFNAVYLLPKFAALFGITFSRVLWTPFSPAFCINGSRRSCIRATRKRLNTRRKRVKLISANRTRFCMKTCEKVG